ncbi:hypothetical protein NLJ89_g10017 [Agrocybe chaxingu]|uniref:F-box domain-containing protein n=1 Tax=Agrocybe chaxingu TaxID=84603 RepID=A0A9W8JSH8_9AGAR|nr:hypothetical protein NLJ89_g10017 [Agrocybe chaxingu]
MERLPYDIFHKIALYSLPEHPSPTRNQAPISLCQVSAAWRAAGLSTPSLWSTLFLNIRDIRALKTYKKRVIKWFGRAEACSISFYIYFTPEDAILDATNAIPSMLAHWAPLMPQVKHLGIGSDRVTAVLHHFANVAWDLRALEALELFNQGPCSSKDYASGERLIPHIPMLAKGTPNLRSVTIQNDFIMLCGAKGFVPWAQLTHVFLTEALLIEDWLSVMTLCTQMQEGEFLVDEGLPYPLPPRCTHTHLECLKLRLAYGIDYSILDLLNLVDLPRLRVLALGHEDRPASDDPPPPPPSSISCLRHIETLMIDHGWCSNPKYVVEILREAVELRELQLESVCAEEDVIIKALREGLVPRLRTLRIFANRPLDDPSDAVNVPLLLEMLKTRCGPDGLQDVDITADCWPEAPRSRIGELKAGVGSLVSTAAGFSVRLNLASDDSWDWVEVPKPIFRGWMPPRAFSE